MNPIGGSPATAALRVRWLGRVRYRDAHALQRALFRRGEGEYLLLLEHPHVYTLGVRARAEHVLVDPAAVGAELVRTDRGGDVTYHGPGQLVGYPVLSVPMGPGAVPAHVARVEQLVIDTLAELGLPGTGRLEGYPGVWVDPDGAQPRKICAIGVRVNRGRSMHGFALNIDPEMAMFGHIVPCGIADKAVTSLRNEGIAASMEDVVRAMAARAAAAFGLGRAEVQAASWFPHRALDAAGALAGSEAAPVRPLERRLRAAGVDPATAVSIGQRKPPWLRVKAHMGPEFVALKNTMRSLSLVTVCEEAGCPNIFECWADGTATFMINGDRCTRACGFCLVDTRRPFPLDAAEPEHVAEAVARMGLAHAVVTAVARDDLADGGAAAFAETIAAVRRRCPGTAVEVLVPDFKGDPDALATVLDARPDVFDHNLETVLRLQRAVRPSAAYARSLAVLATAAGRGLRTKSSLVLGMGETESEVLGALADLRAVGVEIVTLGQYLRPTRDHLPVVRWWRPEELGSLASAGMAMGFAHVQASPLTRSSYHARAAAGAAAAAAGASTPVAAAVAGVGEPTTAGGRAAAS
jgi:lipoic acid synthetase